MGNEGQQAGKVTRALVVSDDPSMQHMLHWMLTPEGYTIETAGTGREALAILRASREPRIMLFDVIMPDVIGREVLEALVAEPELAERTACVLVTMLVDRLPVELVNQLQALVLAYPFTCAQVLSSVAKAAARLPAR